MDKELARGLLIQIAGFMRMFGSSVPRLKAMANLIDAITVPAVWDKVWAVIEANPTLKDAFSQALDADSSAFEAIGAEQHFAKNPISTQAARSPEYIKTRNGVMGVMMILLGFVSMTPNKKDDEYYQLVNTIMWGNFDDAWVVDHPNEFKP